MSKTLRLQGKRFYCTWSQNDTDKEYVASMLICGPEIDNDDLDWYVIGREQVLF